MSSADGLQEYKLNGPREPHLFTRVQFLIVQSATEHNNQYNE